jgi:acyl CoA:acetate/3-ketoacid CoA transferase
MRQPVLFITERAVFECQPEWGGVRKLLETKKSKTKAE